MLLERQLRQIFSTNQGEIISPVLHNLAIKLPSFVKLSNQVHLSYPIAATLAFEVLLCTWKGRPNEKRKGWFADMQHVVP